MVSMLIDNQRELMDIARMLWNNKTRFYTTEMNGTVSVTVSEKQGDYDYYNALTILNLIEGLDVDTLRFSKGFMSQIFDAKECVNIYIDVQDLFEKAIDYKNNISQLYTLGPCELVIFWINELLDDYDDLTLHRDMIGYLLYITKYRASKDFAKRYQEDFKLPLTWFKD